MQKLELELYEGLITDTLTNETTQKAVSVKSGMRNIYISINTLVQIKDFLKEKGILI